jgi:hypothetical protein
MSKSARAERHCHAGAVPACIDCEERMKYLLMIFGDEAREQAADPDETARVMGAYRAYSEALAKAGVMVGGERLRPTASATTVRMRGGRSEVLNGPYAETKEQFGGYYIVDVPDLDAALSWAARCPGASHGAVEVRPVWEM